MAKCCFFFSLRTGCYIAVSYSIFVSVVFIIRLAVVQHKLLEVTSAASQALNPANNPRFQQLMASFPQESNPNNQQHLASVLQGARGTKTLIPAQGASPFTVMFHKAESVEKIIFGLTYAILAGWILTALVFVAGLRRNCQTYMVPWLFYTVCFTGFQAVGFICLAAITAAKIIPPEVMSAGAVAVQLIVAVFLLAVNAYSCWCVWTLYIQMLTGVETTMVKGSFMPLAEYSDEPELKSMTEDREDVDKFEI